MPEYHVAYGGRSADEWRGLGYEDVAKILDEIDVEIARRVGQTAWQDDMPGRWDDLSRHERDTAIAGVEAYKRMLRARIVNEVNRPMLDRDVPGPGSAWIPADWIMEQTK